MDFTEYQERTADTAIYPRDLAVEYLTLGLVSEAGEIAGKAKKALRDFGGGYDDQRRAEILAEIGDCAWYLARLADEFDADLGAIAQRNLWKLQGRKARGTLGGSGDER